MERLLAWPVRRRCSLMQREGARFLKAADLLPVIERFPQSEKPNGYALICYQSLAFARACKPKVAVDAADSVLGSRD